MRVDLLRRVLGAMILPVAAVGCVATERFFRPGGDGGWKPERRRAEVERLARPAAIEPSSSTVASSGPIDLATALRLAARGNRRLAAARSRLAMAEQDVWIARSRLLPATAGSGRYTWYTDPLTNRVDLPAGLLPPGSEPVVTIRESEAGVVNGTVTLPVDLTGELRHALAGAQAGYRGEKARLWAETLDQKFAVVNAYYDLLEAKRLHEVATQSLAARREQLEHARRRFDAGRLTRNQLLVVEVALIDAEQTLRQRDLAIDRARWRLNDGIGIAVDAPTDVIDVDSPPRVPEFPEALRTAHARNPVLVALLEERQQLESSLVSLERSRFPRVVGGAAVDSTTSDIVDPQNVGSGFVGFTWDLGSDGRREAEIARARHASRRNRSTLEAELRNLESFLRVALRTAQERLAALEAAEAALVQAEENLAIRRQQFDAGRATSEDVLDAETLLSRHRAIRAVALYQAHARLAEAHRLMGIDLDSPNSTAAAETVDTVPAPVEAAPPAEPAASSSSPEWRCERTVEGARCAKRSANGETSP